MHFLKTIVVGTAAIVLLSAYATHAQTSPDVAADTSPDSPPTESASAAPPVPLLWKVSDADNSLYLLGSFHMLKPSDYPLSGDVDAALADAEALLLELGPEEMNSPALGIAMGQAAMRTDGSKLGDQLDSQAAAQLDDWLAANAASLQKMGMTPEVLRIFEPWFGGLMISIVEMTKQGLNPEFGLDKHMAAAAAKAGIPAAGLETGAQQIALFDEMSFEAQLQMLKESLEEVDSASQEIKKLHALWRAGDAKGLWTGMATDMRNDYPLLYQRINVQRNDNWIPKLQARLEQPGSDDTLVVVGALHLLGEDGVVEKLRVRGYTVQRICSACDAAKP